MHMHVLHRNFLLSFAAAAIERIEQQGISTGEFVGLAQILTPALKGLLTNHRTLVAFHCGIVRGEELRCDHSLDVFRGNSDERRHRGFALTLAPLTVRILDPKCLNGLIEQRDVPVVRRRPAEIFKVALKIDVPTVGAFVGTAAAVL